MRKLLGLKFLGETTSEVVWAIGDIEVTAGHVDKEVRPLTPYDHVVDLNTFINSI